MRISTMLYSHSAFNLNYFTFHIRTWRSSRSERLSHSFTSVVPQRRTVNSNWRLEITVNLDQITSNCAGSLWHQIYPRSHGEWNLKRSHSQFTESQSFRCMNHLRGRTQNRGVLRPPFFQYEEADDDDESTANSEDEDFIRDHTSRISSLTINLNETMLTTLFRELPFSFPSLWHLQIENDTINSEIVPILPAFVEEHPPLHKLSLRRVIIPFHLQGSTFFCNLRELSIWYQYGTMNDNRNGGGALTPSLTSLLGVLECCNTQLLLLELVHLNFKGSSLSSDNRMVELPSLKRLLLKSEAGQIASLLSHLILPPKCVLRLYGGELTQTSSHGLKEILPRNHRLLPSLQEIKELHFRANTSDYTVNIDGNPSSALFQIDLDWNEDVSIDDLTPLFINVVADNPLYVS
ncbi:hypothetical protein ABKN59_008934 [Abortiporus biennis]